MMTNLDKLAQFNDEVFEYLEFLGVPDLVLGYDPLAISTSFTGTIISCYRLGQSCRMTAIIIFALTMDKIQKEPITHIN